MRGKSLSELVTYKLADTQKKLITSTQNFSHGSSINRNMKLTNLDIHCLVGMKFPPAQTRQIRQTKKPNKPDSLVIVHPTEIRSL